MHDSTNSKEAEVKSGKYQTLSIKRKIKNKKDPMVEREKHS